MSAYTESDARLDWIVKRNLEGLPWPTRDDLAAFMDGFRAARAFPPEGGRTEAASLLAAMVEMHSADYEYLEHGIGTDTSKGRLLLRAREVASARRPQLQPSETK